MRTLCSTSFTTHQRAANSCCGNGLPPSLVHGFPSSPNCLALGIRRVSPILPMSVRAIRQERRCTPVPEEVFTVIPKLECLKEELRRMLVDACDQVEDGGWYKSVELINDLQRLGIAYHFQQPIVDDFLRRLHVKIFCASANYDALEGADLQHVALGFRLLRQQGHYVSPRVFDQFGDGNGGFKAELSKDTRAMLNLYEASYLSVEGEDMLEVARLFTETQLKASMHKLTPNSELATSLEHALEQPLHWGVPRSEARHYMESLCQTKGGHLSQKQLVMLEFARLDFNHVQSLYQKELEEVCKWWDELGLGDVMKIPRNDVPVYFAWSLILDGPQESRERVLLTKLNAVIFVVDDIYDVWGELEDIQILTEAVRRWNDLTFVDELPRHLKMAFMAFDSVINEIGDYVFMQHNVNAFHHLWAETLFYCEESLKVAEKERTDSKHEGSAEEYLNNKMISLGAHLIMFACFFLLGETMSPDTTDYIDRFGLAWHAATIIRISNDLDATKNGREGDSSYLRYSMIEHGGSMDAAVEEASRRMADEWKKLNHKCLKPNAFSTKFISTVQNFCRVCLVLQDGGKGREKKILKDLVF